MEATLKMLAEELLWRKHDTHTVRHTHCEREDQTQGVSGCFLRSL